MYFSFKAIVEDGKMTSEISFVEFFVWLLNFKIKPPERMEWYESWNFETSPKWLNLKMGLHQKPDTEVYERRLVSYRNNIKLGCTEPTWNVVISLLNELPLYISGIQKDLQDKNKEFRIIKLLKMRTISQWRGFHPDKYWTLWENEFKRQLGVYSYEFGLHCDTNFSQNSKSNSVMEALARTLGI